MADIILSEKDIARFWAKTSVSPKQTWGGTFCLEWTGSRFKRSRYGQFRMPDKTVGAHRVAWTIAHGQIPEGLCVLHHCDRPPCVEAQHLFLGTQADNAHDRDQKRRNNAASGVRHGSKTHPESRARGDRHGARLHPERIPRGAAHATARLTEADVREIRALTTAGISQEKLGRRFGVSQTTVGRAVRFVTWAHLG